jgi:hypothetical protein
MGAESPVRPGRLSPRDPGVTGVVGEVWSGWRCTRVLGDHLPVGPHKPADSDVWESQPDCFFYGCASLQQGTRRSRDHQNRDNIDIHVEGKTMSLDDP